MNENSVRSALDKLESSGYISIKATNKYSVITLLKWGEYNEISNFFTNKTPTDHQQATNKPPQYNKEKNKKKEKNYSARAREREKIKKGSIDWSLIDEIVNA